MKYIILILLFVGCKHSAEYNGKAVEYDEHTFSDQVDLYVGKRIIKKFKYTSKEKKQSVKVISVYEKSGQFSCYYSGMCMHYSAMGKNPGYKYGFSSSCSGNRHEVRAYTQTLTSPVLYYKNRRNELKLILSDYKSTSYRTLRRGSCR